MAGRSLQHQPWQPGPPVPRSTEYLHLHDRSPRLAAYRVSRPNAAEHVIRPCRRTTANEAILQGPIRLLARDHIAATYILSKISSLGKLSPILSAPANWRCVISPATQRQPSTTGRVRLSHEFDQSQRSKVGPPSSSRFNRNVPKFLVKAKTTLIILCSVSPTTNN